MVQRKVTMRGFLIAGVALLPLLALTTPAQAQVISSIYTRTGNLYNYSYSVTNNTADSLALVTLNLPNPISLTNLTAPSGFGIGPPDATSAAPTFTLLDLYPLVGGVGSPDFFPGTTVRGFNFSTPTFLAAVPYSVLSSNPNTPQVNGNTTALSAPEASPLVLALLGGAVLGLCVVRRRATVR